MAEDEFDKKLSELLAAESAAPGDDTPAVGEDPAYKAELAVEPEAALAGVRILIAEGPGEPSEAALPQQTLVEMEAGRAALARLQASHRRELGSE